MRILIVDDHPLIPEALAALLGSLNAECVVEGATDLRIALERANAGLPPDLVLLDLGMPGQIGLSALAAFREARPELPVVVISGDESSERVIAALDLGAMGFIPKTAKKEVLLSALRVVIAGGIYVPPSVQYDAEFASNSPVRSASTTSTAGDIGLTGRQAQVLGLLLRGMSNKLICKELGLAEGTVKIHISAILKALGVSNRTQAVLAANRIGLRI